MNRARRRGEDGYAMVVAVAAIVVFALIAMSVQAAGGGALAIASAEDAHARAVAAADAGFAMALAALLSDEPGGHWQPDGRTRDDDFAGHHLIMRVEDERGKVPINLVDEAQADKLLELAGVQGERERIARDSLLDWIDPDDDPRPDGAESPYYASRHIAARNGELQTIDELALIRGFDPALVARLRPIVTVNWDGGPFEARYASPEALAVMGDEDADSPDAIERRRELAGQTTALDFTQGETLSGHIVRILVEAHGAGGSAASKTWVVKLTGNGARPYVILSLD